MPTLRCSSCVFSKETVVGLECRHAAAKYQPVSFALATGEREQHHSATHMRARGACSVDAKLYLKKGDFHRGGD